MKKLNKFFKKSAVITLSCTSLLQFTSVFAEGPENSNVGKSPSSVFEASNPLYYEVIPDAVADGPNSHKPPRPTHSQKKEQTLTPKKPTKESHTEEGERIDPYKFAAGTRNIPNFDVFKTVRSKHCLNHHKNPAIYKEQHNVKHLVKYQKHCGCTKTGNQNSNSSMGKPPSSVFRASNPLYYKVIPGAVADGTNSHKPPRPTHSQKKEQTLTPKKPTKESHTEEGVRIGVYEFPAGIRDITNFDVFKDVRPTKCCNHHNKPATYKTICVDRHAVKYQNNCGCTNRSVAYQDLGGVLGWKLARAAVLAGYQVPPSQRSRDGWDIYANPAAESELEKNLISDGLWIEKMRLDALPKDLKYADGKEFTEIDKQILCEIKQKKYL